jgi:hypothetical protein
MIFAIRQNNGGTAEIHNSLDTGEAASVLRDTFPQYAAQANALKTVFAGATADNSALTAKFTALKNAEEAIRTAGSGRTLTQRLNTVDTQRNIIINTIFNGNADDYNEFTKYYNAYTKGQYLITADWNTRPGDLAEAENAFKLARDPLAAAGLITATTTGTIVPRSTELHIGSNVSAQFADMETGMKTRIISALGLTGVTNADAMAEALVIQLAQDQKEYRAFIDDITAEGLLSTGLGDYQVPVAAVGPQSAVRLAAVSPEKKVTDTV